MKNKDISELARKTKREYKPKFQKEDPISWMNHPLSDASAMEKNYLVFLDFLFTSENPYLHTSPEILGHNNPEVYECKNFLRKYVANIEYSPQEEQLFRKHIPVDSAIRIKELFKIDHEFDALTPIILSELFPGKDIEPQFGGIVKVNDIHKDISGVGRRIWQHILENVYIPNSKYVEELDSIRKRKLVLGREILEHFCGDEK